MKRKRILPQLYWKPCSAKFGTLIDYFTDAGREKAHAELTARGIQHERIGFTNLIGVPTGIYRLNNLHLLTEGVRSARTNIRYIRDKCPPPIDKSLPDYQERLSWCFAPAGTQVPIIEYANKRFPAYPNPIY
jgi:hypothetical protein